MTPENLRDLLIAYCERKPRQAAEQTVVIQTANSGCPSRPVSELAVAMGGADWSHNFYLLYPKDKLVFSKELKVDSRDFAEKRLQELVDAHSRLGFQYIPKSHKSSWIEGFVECIRQQFTGVDSGNV